MNRKRIDFFETHHITGDYKEVMERLFKMFSELQYLYDTDEFEVLENKDIPGLFEVFLKESK